MNDLLKEYHPRTLGKVLVQAAENDDYEMVALASIMLTLSPIMYPVMVLVTGYGIVMAKFVNWLLNHKD